MEKTLKQIADELGIDKQRLYRFVKKNHISEAHHEAHQKNAVKQYDEAAQSLILSRFSGSEVHHEAHHEAHQNRIKSDTVDTVNDTLIEMLKTELEIKNRQIDELNARLAETSAALVSAQQTAQAAQALHAGTIKQLSCSADLAEEQQKSEVKKKKRWWQR